MAIIFSKPISTTTLLNAYNNNNVTFNSDSGLTAVKCSLTINGIVFEITPINNVFKYNFREVSKVLINSTNFEDNTLPSLVLANATSHVYDDTAGTYLTVSVDYTITFSNATTETINKVYKFLKSVEQLEQTREGVVIGGMEIYMLSTFQQSTADTYDVTYHEGYPFDISIYLETPGLTTVLNQTNALSYTFNLPSKVNRLFFSDGRTTITIDDYLPLMYGLNRLKITKGLDSIYVNVTKKASTDGQYIKWLNQYGGWNYWLFNCLYKKTRITKSLGIVNNDFNNVNETKDSFITIGKDSGDKITIVTEGLSIENQNVLNGILDSPKVYYFTGIRLSRVTNVSWLAVDLTDGTDIIKEFKTDYKKYKFEISMPERYTMTL